MCGITGIIRKKGLLQAEDVAIVGGMNDALTHRGPDEMGSFNDSICALAMRRLSIIDLAGGSQPVYNEDGNVLAFLNGEIYNFVELRELLQSKGHTFTTHSDTEVLVHLYEEYGENLFEYLNGMYAFCIYDKTKKQCIIGRDALGEKPLYYFQNTEQFIFSSELKSLLENKNVPRVLNEDSLRYYLRTSLIPSPITMFQDIKILPAGHFIFIKENDVQVKQHFSIDYKVEANIKSTQDAIDHISPLLHKVVKQQATSDVPIGAFLSGGIDSSSLVSLLQKQSSSKIKTFNVKFEDQQYDESKIAREVADFCGTNHHEVLIADAQFTEDIFWDIIDHVGQPFRDSSAIPTYFITKAIREHVKVAISGDGGDELFAGYDLFQWYTKISNLKSAVPDFLLNMGKSAVGAAAKSGLLDGSSKVRQINRALGTAANHESDLPLALNEQFTESEIDNLLQDKVLVNVTPDDYKLLKQYPTEYANWSSLRKIMYYRSKYTLPDNMLVKVDRMSMANSLEVRAPFLDKNLFNAAAQLPDEFLIRDGVGKFLIREIMKDDLPKSVFDHPKQGFNMPLHKYQNEAYVHLAQRLLFDENPMPHLFKKSALKQIYDRGINAKKSTSNMSVFRASHQLWMMMQFFGWAKRYNVTSKY